MPTYDYRCDLNDQTVEVNHRISEKLHTWGELCTRAGIELNGTPADTAVQRLATGGQPIHSSSLANPEAPACGTGSCGMGACGTGMCGLD